MELFTVDRPKSFLSDGGMPSGTTATIKFSYHELVLLEHALYAYKDKCEAENSTLSEEDKVFIWQFNTIRHLLKHGAPDGFDAELYVHEIKHGKTCFSEIEKREKKARMKNHGSTVETENSAKAKGQAQKKK